MLRIYLPSSMDLKLCADVPTVDFVNTWTFVTIFTSRHLGPNIWVLANGSKMICQPLGHLLGPGGPDSRAKVQPRFYTSWFLGPRSWDLDCGLAPHFLKGKIKQWKKFQQWKFNNEKIQQWKFDNENGNNENLTMKIQQWKWQQWKFDNENSYNENLTMKMQQWKCQQWKMPTMKMPTMKKQQWNGQQWKSNNENGRSHIVEGFQMWLIY